jgi:DeoR family fructose operon transcriptional repressor
MIEAQTKSAMMRAAKTVILLVDHTKFSKATLGRFGGLKDVHIVITDREAPQETIEAIIANGTEVIQV